VSLQFRQCTGHVHANPSRGTTRATRRAPHPCRRRAHRVSPTSASSVTSVDPRWGEPEQRERVAEGAPRDVQALDESRFFRTISPSSPRLHCPGEFGTAPCSRCHLTCPSARAGPRCRGGRCTPSRCELFAVSGIALRGARVQLAPMAHKDDFRLPFGRRGGADRPGGRRQRDGDPMRRVISSTVR
jgi:hypothetical protein